MDGPTTDLPSIIAFAEREQLLPEGALISGKEIGDGNVNYVYRLDDSRTGQSVILKLAMPYFRCVGESYPLNIERSAREATALEIQDRFAPGLVPKVYRRYDAQGIFVMEDLSRLQVMRHAMLELVKYPLFAEHISTFIASVAFFTSDLATASGDKKILEKLFVNPELCKIQEDLIFSDPYFDCDRNVVNPKLRPYLEKVFWKDQEIRLEASRYKHKFMTSRECLIHGDLHTGSIFVNQERTVVFDPEFCFMGPTAFDVGKLLGNLAINYFCWSGRPADPAARDDYRRYLHQTMIDVYTKFAAKYAAHWETAAKDPIAKVPGYKAHYLRTLFVDMVAYWAIVMIRRMHGLARNVDVEGIPDEDRRAQVQTGILRAAAHLLRRKSEFETIADVSSAVLEFVP